MPQFLYLLLLLLPLGLCAQVRDGLYGQTGIVLTPDAGVEEDRRATLGWQTVPKQEAHLDYSRKHGVGERVWFARIGFLPRVEASLRLVHPERARGRYGIGDRSVFLKVALLRESGPWPALAAGVYDPMGTRLLPAAFLCAAKSLPLHPAWRLRVSAGYAAPVFGAEEDYLLRGPWAGIQLLPAPRPDSWWPLPSAGLEWHRGQFNAAAALHLRSFLQLNAWLLRGRHPALGASVSLRL
jgi:hypothetical protein